MNDFLNTLAYRCGQRAYQAGRDCTPFYGFEEDDAAWVAGWLAAQAIGIAQSRAVEDEE
jgi:hypothetical protein